MIEPAFGTTAPFLAIAKAYDVPYELPLLLADSMQHGREIPDEYAELFAATPLVRIERITHDVRYVCEWMDDLRNGAISL